MRTYYSPALLKSAFILVLTLVCSIHTSSAQAVLQTEGFESTIFPAPGWKTLRAVTTVTGAFTQAGNPLNNPATTAPIGTKVTMFNSATATINDSAYLISKPFDFSNCGATNPTFHFRMYRDNGFAAANDRIQVYLNTSPTTTGMIPVNHMLGTNVIHRNNTLSPAATANTWNQYDFNLNAATYNGGPKKVYIILLGIARGGNNMFIDNFWVNTFPSPTAASDVSMNIVQQSTASIGTSTANQWIIGVRCVVDGNSGCGNVALGTAVKIDSMLFNTIGTTNVGDIQNARVWYTGGSQLFSTGYISPFPAGGYPTPNYGQVIGTPATDLHFVSGAPSCFHLEYDTSYFWLTYDIKSSAVAGNHLDANFLGASGSPGGGPCPTPAGSATSEPFLTTVFSLAGNADINLPYCIPTFYSGWTWSVNQSTDFIQRVEFLSAVPPSFINTHINSPSLQNPASPCYPNCPFTSHPPDYELWSKIPGQTVNLTQGGTYTFRAQCGTWGSGNFIQAWIDFNHDGIFDPITERLAPTLTNLTANSWQNFTFTVPATGYTGNTRLRVREVFAVSNPDPCATYVSGETEDFDIVILPNCPVGYKLWLGNNNNWNDPANWCGGVPTSADSTVINKAQVPGLAGRSYFAPVIKSNVKANTKGLYVSTLDSLIIDAPTPADTALRIHSGLWNHGKFFSKGGQSNSFTISNGTLDNTIYTPFRGSAQDARCQIMYTAAELTAQGMVANDIITQIGFVVTTKGSSLPFNGFTISYGFQPAGTTAFPGNTALPTPNTVFGPTAFSTVLGANTITLSTPIIWNGTSALVIQYCFDNPSVTGNDLIKITQTTGSRRVLLLTQNTGANSGCSLVFGMTGVSDNFHLSAGINRPNFTFYVSKSYQKVKIGLKGEWHNSGEFIPGNSVVIMDSAMSTGISGTSITRFHELDIKKNTISNTVTMARPIIVEDTLYSTQGKLLMNKNSITMKNPVGTETNSLSGVITMLNGPFSRTNGMIVSEDSLSKVIWEIGAFSGPVAGVYHPVPFGTIAGTYIPFAFKHNSGDLGNFTVATYGTNAANSPYPPTVFHMNDTGAVVVDNSAAAADRFWITQKGNATATADMTFRWTASERPTLPTFNALNPPRAYPWRVSSNGIGTWLRTYVSPTNSGAQLMISPGLTHSNYVPTDSLRVTAFNWPMIVAGNAPWTTPPQPMPDYTVWTVAGSINSSALGNGVSTLSLQTDSLKPECNQGANGAWYITVTGATLPVQYNWSNGATTADATGLVAGNYTVTVTDASGASQTLSATIVNINSPAAPASISGPARVCPGSTGIVYSVPVVPGAPFYNWILPPYMTAVTPLNQPTIVVNIGANVTPATIEARQGNECGFSSARTKMIRTVIPGMPGAISGPNYGVCSSNQSYSVAPVANATTYQWIVPAGVMIVNGQGTANVIMNFPSGFGVDTIRVIAGNTCSFGPERKLTVRGKPGVPGAITGPSTACNGQSGVQFGIAPVYGASSYIWNKPTGSTITHGQFTANIQITFGPNSGNVTVKAVNGCGTSGPATKAIVINCREGELRSSELEVFPNPSQNEFAIEGNFENGTVLIQVFDITGKEVYSNRLEAGQKFGSEFVPGVYIVHFPESTGKPNIRIVKL